MITRSRSLTATPRCATEALLNTDARGLKDLIAILARHGVAEVAIERADGPLVEALLSPPV